MSSTWIRGKAQRPTKRRLVLIYETIDPKNAVLEQLLEQIPYGQCNKQLLECLRLGAAQTTGNLGSIESRPLPDGGGAKKEQAPIFSKTAKKMFEMGDQN